MKRIQVQDIAYRWRSVIPVKLDYVQGLGGRSIIYPSLANVDGTDLTAEVLRMYYRTKDNLLILEVKPYGKE